MNNKIERVSKNETVFTITVDKEEVFKEWENQVFRLGKNIKVDGFRPDRIPASILATKIDSTKLQSSVISIFLERYLFSAIQKEKLVPYVRPKLEIIKFRQDSELIFKVTVVSKPQVKIKDYKNINAKPKKPKEITQADVDKLLDEIYQKVNKEKSESAILGPSGEMLKAKAKIDDQFAQNLGAKSLPDLKEKLYKNLETESVVESEKQFEQEIFDKLLNQTEVELPNELIDMQIDAEIENFKSRLAKMGGDYREYLKTQKKSEEQLRQEFMPEAKQRLKLSLALEEIAATEKIVVTDDEVNSQFPENHQPHQGWEQEAAQIKTVIGQQKAIQFLKNQSKQLDDQT